MMPHIIPHPCEGLSAAARRAFDEIAAGNVPKASARTLDRLVELGLVERTVHLTHFADGLPAARTYVFSVSIPLHIAWCEHTTSARKPIVRRRRRKPAALGPGLFDDPL
jgi:hypothetical protein